MGAPKSTAQSFLEKIRESHKRGDTTSKRARTRNYPSRTSEFERIAAVKAFQALGDNTAIDSILHTLKQLLDVGCAGITFLDSQEIDLRQSEGDYMAEGLMQSLPGFCYWTIVTEEPVTMVVEDTLLDARLSTTEPVTKPPHVRFYAASPLVTSSKLRIGNLCTLDNRPMRFGDAQAAALNNLAELIMRVLEGALLQQNPSSPILRSGAGRSVAAYDQAYALVDTSIASWRVLHANPAFSRYSDLPESSGVDGSSPGFWDLFVKTDERQSMDGIRSVSLSSQDSNASDLAREAACWRVQSKRSGVQMSAVTRPLTAEKLDEHAIPLGNPARMPGGDLPERVEASRLDAVLFVLLKAEAVPRKRQRLPIRGLRLGSILGAGSYARVYRGIFDGTKVAVKVAEDDARSTDGEGALREALTMRKLNHPNIVRLIDHRPASATEKRHWLVLEFCSAGSLSNAIDRGMLCETRKSGSPPCLDSVLATGAELANALAHIHAAGIVHCDISADNVLLDACPKAARGFVAKISDFGLAGLAPVAMPDDLLGNAPYFAPELLSGSPPTQASDVYALGVLLVEMLTGCRAWAGYTMAQIYYTVVVTEERFCTPDSVVMPDALRAAIDACLASTTADRPSAEQLSLRLGNLMRGQGGGAAVPGSTD